MSNYHAAGFLSFVLFLTLTGCSPAPAPDLYPTGTAVTLKMRILSPESISNEQFKLGPRSSQLFLDMLTNLPVHSEISRMPAAPYGRFSIGTVDYLWHGNAVIRGTGRAERLWHSPYLQRLIIEVTGKKDLTNRQSVEHILDA